MSEVRKGRVRDPIVSVVVATCGRPSMLREALASLQAQTYHMLEVIVVDDAGDPPADISWLQDPRFRLVRPGKRGGPARARNLGAQLSAGEILGFLDDDDAWLPSRLEDSLRYFADGDLVVCGVQAMGSDKVTLPHHEGYEHGSILNGISPSLGQVLIRKDAFLPFNPDYLACQDLEWWIRTTRTAQVVSAPVAGFVWRKHHGVRTTNGRRARVEFSQRLLRDHRDYFDRHPRAKAFRLRRIAVMAAEVGDLRTTGTSLARAFLVRPSWGLAKDVARSWRLVRGRTSSVAATRL